MGEGAFLSCRDEAQRKDLFLAAEAAGVKVRELPPLAEDFPAFSFRRGAGLVRVTLFTSECPWWIHLSWGHTFNPFRWSADKQLEGDIERLFREHGCFDPGPGATEPPTPSSDAPT
jgi:hypothetical protein